MELYSNTTAAMAEPSASHLESSISAIVKYIRENKRVQREERVSKKTVWFRLLLITIWGINSILPYNCLQLSNFYILNTLFKSPFSANKTWRCPQSENDFLYSVLPSSLTWTLQILVFVIHLVVIIYTLATKFVEAETGQYEKKPCQVLVGVIGSVCGFIGMILLKYHIHYLTPCKFVLGIVGIFLLTVYFGIISGLLQIYGSAFGACLGGRALNAFTIGLDVSGLITSLIAIIFATKDLNDENIVMANIYLSLICYFLLLVCGLCYYRSKDHAVTRRVAVKPSLKNRKGPCFLLHKVISGNGFFPLQSLVFIQTFFIFPATLIHVRPQQIFITPVLWYPLVILFNFAICASVVSVASHWIFKCVDYLSKFYSPKFFFYFLLFLVILRFPLIIYLALFSNYKPPAVSITQQFILISDEEFIALVSLIAISHSLIVSLCDIHIGRKAKVDEHAQVFGFGLSIMKLFGIVIGLGLSFFFMSVY